MGRRRHGSGRACRCSARPVPARAPLRSAHLSGPSAVRRRDSCNGSPRRARGTRDCRQGGLRRLEHVAKVECDVEGEWDRPAAEFAPSSPSSGPTVVGLDGAPIGRRLALREQESVTRIAHLVFAASFAAGCAPDGPLGTVGATVTAPITAPGMFVSARMNDREDHLERARRNERPLPPGDARSREIARKTLEQALARSTVDDGLYRQNDDDANGYAAGGVTVLATGRTGDGRPCREVLIETAMERRPTDQRVRTSCRAGTGWDIVAFTAGAPVRGRGDGR